MTKLTKEQFIQTLKDFKGDVVKLTYTTDVPMNKRNNPFFEFDERRHSLQPVKSVRKRVTAYYGFGYSYQSLVNQQLAKQGSDEKFTAKKSDWQETVVPSKVYAHKDTKKLYLRVFIDDGTDPESEYLVDGKPATEKELVLIDNFERKYSSESYGIKTQSDLGIDQKDQVRVLTVRFENIDSISLDGDVYELDKSTLS